MFIVFIAVIYKLVPTQQQTPQMAYHQPGCQINLNNLPTTFNQPLLIISGACKVEDLQGNFKHKEAIKDDQLIDVNSESIIYPGERVVESCSYGSL